jgi:hypothetical protein
MSGERDQSLDYENKNNIHLVKASEGWLATPKPRLTPGMYANRSSGILGSLQILVIWRSVVIASARSGGRSKQGQRTMRVIAISTRSGPRRVAGCTVGPWMLRRRVMSPIIRIITFAWSGPRGVAGYTEAHAYAWPHTSRSPTDP